MNETEKLLEWARSILDNERHKSWKIVVRKMGGGALCNKENKTIVIEPEDVSHGLLLHEIAHIKKAHNKCIDGIGHHGIFADQFTRLVNKYCNPKE